MLSITIRNLLIVQKLLKLSDVCASVGTNKGN